MAEPPDPVALVPLSNSNGSPTAFSQQGTIDWTALGRMQLSASVAIVGRLAAAGIESLTVAVGQILCNRVPIGAHGEKVLMESMAKLKSFSAFGDVVWFGIGIRHVLRSLVHTSQGASCVALCAALTECNSREASALVLYEMAKRSGSPHDLSPSVSQWEAMIKTCASIFTPSTFGIRVQQLLRLGGYPGTSDESSDPRDIADALFAVGSVATGEIACIKISGVASCVWVAAYADYVMGMRVHMESTTGDIIWMNYSESKSDAQIIVTVETPSPDGSNILAQQSISRTIIVRSGNNFICQALGLPDDHAPFFIGGRIEWDNVLEETMGDERSAFQYSQETSGRSRNAEDTDDLDQQHLPPSYRLEWFAEMIVSTACYALVSPHLYASRVDFYRSICTAVPELQNLEKTLMAADDRLQEQLRDPVNVSKIYNLAKYQLKAHCNCPKHTITSHCQMCPERKHCLTRYARFIMLLAHFRKLLVIETPIHPSAAGIRLLFKMFQPYASSMKTHFGIPGPTKKHMYVPVSSISSWNIEKVYIPNAYLQKRFDPEIIHLGSYFQCVIACFSGFESEKWEKSNEISARSDGKIYCYIHTLTEISDDAEIVSRIHVGAGSIYSNHRPYTAIFDKDHSTKAKKKYNWPSVEECTGFSSLWQDTSSQLTLRAFAEESNQLRFWYTVFGNGREVSISPVQIFRDICKAAAWRGSGHPGRKPLESITLPSYVHEQTCLMVCGEGKLQPGLNQENIVLRPHQGNIIGKCVVLTLTDADIFLLKSKDDLETALKVDFDYVIQRSNDEESMEESKERADRKSGTPRCILLS